VVSGGSSGGYVYQLIVDKIDINIRITGQHVLETTCCIVLDCRHLIKYIVVYVDWAALEHGRYLTIHLLQWI
jgi:hypothetical protein